MRDRVAIRLNYSVQRCNGAKWRRSCLGCLCRGCSLWLLTLHDDRLLHPGHFGFWSAHDHRNRRAGYRGRLGLR
jgi:hypothetical protein